MRPLRIVATVIVMAMIAAACGQPVLVREIDAPADSAQAPTGSDQIEPSGAGLLGPGPGALAGGDAQTVTKRAGGGVGSATADGGTTPIDGDGRKSGGPRQRRQRCAKTATDVGVTRDKIVWGTILPLSGPLRPIGEQTARVMKRTVDYFNSVDHDPSRPALNWGCAGRRGIYGREVELRIASISSDSEDDVLQAMRRLVDVEKPFLVRDCYLTSALLGPAHDYAERNGVTKFWCFPESLPQPELAPHSFAIGVGRYMQAAMLMGHLVNKMGRSRIAMLYDPTYEEQAEVVRHVAEQLGAEIVAEIQARGRTAVNGRRSEVIALRRANPDAVIVLDALNATYAAVAAGQLQWRPRDSGVAWACNNCWLKFQADVCGENCATMITNTSGVPFKPYEPGSRQVWHAKRTVLPNEPDDVLTFAALIITALLFSFSAEAGPDLTREKFEAVLSTVDGERPWGLPSITTSPQDHFGVQSDWLVQFTGRTWPHSFSDLSQGYVTLQQVGVRPEWSDP